MLSEENEVLLSSKDKNIDNDLLLILQDKINFENTDSANLESLSQIILSKNTILSNELKILYAIIEKSPSLCENILSKLSLKKFEEEQMSIFTDGKKAEIALEDKIVSNDKVEMLELLKFYNNPDTEKK